VGALISICIPVHNRTYDLKDVMPSLQASANLSPPVEIVILDYNSMDDLYKYVQSLNDPNITYRKYFGRSYYHASHARNLSVLASHGEYIVTYSADVYIAPEFVSIIRDKINSGCVWIYGRHAGLIIIKREEFISAGGYDERFEFYGPEDKDLNSRLRRRGLTSCWLHNIFSFNKTPDIEKIKNYRLKISKREMAEQMWVLYQENVANEVLVANPNGWGSWD
jgi:glycosyltransferase involved in cell wall biosynthesis